MTYRFKRSGPIRIQVRIEGPSGRTTLTCALDTGATRSLISAIPLAYVGYDPGAAEDRIEMTTGSGVVYAPLVRIERLSTLGKSKSGLEVIAHTLPPSANLDGLIGLDFLREYRLNIDFQTCEISLD